MTVVLKKKEETKVTQTRPGPFSYTLKPSELPRVEPENQTLLHEGLLRDIGKLKGKTITLAGCGALGSWTARFLARIGVRVVRLIDSDKIEEHNLGTQGFPQMYLGTTKVHALSTFLYQFFKTRAEKHEVRLIAQNAYQLLKNSDLVICTFDNKKSRQIVKDTCLENDIPCVFAGIHGEHFYAQVEWAENFRIPNDPAHYEIDPCNYPLSLSLVLYTCSILLEIVIRHVINGERRSSKTGMLDVLR